MTRPDGTSRVDRLLFALGWLGIAFLITPIVIIFPLSIDPSNYLRFPPTGFSFRWYETYLTSRPWIDSTLLSLEIALFASLLATVLGTGAALALGQARFRGRGAASLVLLTPILLPHIVIAIAVYAVYALFGLVGTKLALVLAHSVLGIPFVMLNVASALRGVPAELDDAAMSLGASPLATLFGVTLPLIWRGILAGAIFAFVVSFDEVVIAMFLSSSTTATLPKRMLDGIFYDLTPVLAAVSALLVIFNIVLALIGLSLAGRRRAAA